MTVHLHLPSHLPHPRIADAFVECLREGLAAHLHRAPVVRTDPATVASWAEWLTPDEYEHQHMGGDS